MNTFKSNNALTKQEKRTMKKKHKQFRELRKKNGNSSLFGKSGSPKEHNAVDYIMYDMDDFTDYSADWNTYVS